eukprot:Skav223506  [mRNA]  locus=scaffold1160:203564:205735:- [translate_table: standard]
MPFLMARVFVHVSGNRTTPLGRDVHMYPSHAKVIADQTFRVSASGDFEPDGASESLYNECATVAVGMACRWNLAAGEVCSNWLPNRYRSILETELQREDGTWVQTVTSVLHWHFLENLDGTLYIQRAPCASLGVESCAAMTTCDRSQSLVPDLQLSKRPGKLLPAINEGHHS